MNWRLVTLVGGAALVLILAGLGLRWSLTDNVEPDAADLSEILPVPPLPPRIAKGADYDKCLALLVSDPDEAASFATTWQAADGGIGAAHCLALSQVALGEPTDGARALLKLAATPSLPPAARAILYSQASHAWLMAGEATQAHSAATIALQLAPDEPDILFDHASASAALDRPADAVADLTALLALDPHYTDALVSRAAAYRLLNQPDRALRDIDRALEQEPDNVEALLERGIQRELRNDTDGARADWEQVIALDPDSAAADLAQQNLSLLEAGPPRP